MVWYGKEPHPPVASDNLYHVIQTLSIIMQNWLIKPWVGMVWFLTRLSLSSLYGWRIFVHERRGRAWV